MCCNALKIGACVCVGMCCCTCTSYTLLMCSHSRAGPACTAMHSIITVVHINWEFPVFCQLRSDILKEISANSQTYWLLFCLTSSKKKIEKKKKNNCKNKKQKQKAQRVSLWGMHVCFLDGEGSRMCVEF